MSSLVEAFLEGEPAPAEAGLRGTPQRPFRVVTVTSNKGGVGKSTVATNLAVYLRALREDLPILFLGFDEQPTADRMFALDAPAPGETVLTAMRSGTFARALRMGQYGVHYVPSNPDVAELKLEIDGPFRLEAALRRTGWRGVVIIDTESNLEILSRNAVAASDLAIVPVTDRASLDESHRIFELLEAWNRPRESARLLLSLIDLRVKFPKSEARDVLALLLSEIQRRGDPMFSSFISRSPLIESLATNPSGSCRPVLHAAKRSLVHTQFRHLAEEVLALLESAGPRAERPQPPSVWSHFPELLRSG